MQKIRYVYILSQRYSGSTLLSFLLGTHPRISTIGERRKFFKHSFLPDEEKIRTCSCGKPFHQCEHWNAIKKNLLARIDMADYSTNPTEFNLFENIYLNRLATETFKWALLHKLPFWPFRKKIARLCTFNRILVEEILNIDGGSVFLDSSKTIEHIPFLSLIPEIDLRVIWLTRDPRAQVNSALKYNRWSVHEAAQNWKKEMVKNAEILDRLQINHSLLGYEQLCRAPEQEMARLLKFLDLDPTGYSLNFRQQTQHIMGNYSMRLGKEVNIMERTEWRDNLSPGQIRVIESVTRDYRSHYAEG